MKLNGERVYIGMLAVDPAQQKSGIGSRMMHEAEDFGATLDASSRYPRRERASRAATIYSKLGYVASGIESAAVIKTATMPVHFITMSKPL